MAVDLTVRIYRTEKRALFFGPGTFSCKERIKQLGPAKWLSNDKTWEVRPFTGTVEELKLHFPDAEFEEFGGLEETGSGESTQQSSLPSSWSVSEFINLAKTALQKAFPGIICVHGVVAKVSRTAQGRVFIDLTDAEQNQQTVSCVIWGSEEKICKGLSDAGFKLETDLQVMFKVQVDLNPKRTALSLVVVGVVAEYTIAKVAALREVTNERLKKEGLFARNKGFKLAFLPRRLGILTSASGTVINDFRASLDESFFGFELFWYKASVQGADAKRDLLKGLEVLSSFARLDAILIFRGGGSPAELSVFNDYDISRAVCLCPVPVLSAIGHEEDQSSVQDVSYRAFGVPKDIGRFFCEMIIGFREKIRENLRLFKTTSLARIEGIEHALLIALKSLCHSVSHMVAGDYKTLERFESAAPVMALSVVELSARQVLSAQAPLLALGRGVLKSAENRLDGVGRRAADRVYRLFEFKRARVGVFGSQILLGAERFIEQGERKLTLLPELFRTAGLFVEGVVQSLVSLERVISDSGPEVQLRRGFTIVRRAIEQNIVTSGVKLKESDEIEIEFHDSRQRAVVK